jgi:hypothetical protein
MAWLGSPAVLPRTNSLKEMEDHYAHHRRREGGVDFTLGPGNPDSDLTAAVCPAWVHLRRSTLVHLGDSIHLVVTLSPSYLRINSAKGL